MVAVSLTTVEAVLSILFRALTRSRRTVDQINQAGSTHSLPPAFPINDAGLPDIPGNPDYRFEGFGVIVFPLQLSFYVHYKPGSPEHVALGRFTIPIGVGELVQLNRLLG